MNKYTLDATKQSLGRVASAAAALLIGKNKETFVRNRAPKVEVQIINAGKLTITEKKKREKIYVSYSGYPGGIKFKSLEKVIEDKGVKEALRKAVLGMLPKNKLKREMILNLKISE